MPRNGRSTWREDLAPVVARVLEQHAGEDIKAIRQALREACPLGQLRFWPYKVWLSEIRRQLAGKKLIKDNGRMPLFE